MAESTSSPDFVAAVDLGSNSFHMIVGQIDGGHLRIVDRLRERVRLAGGFDAEGNIAPDAEARALACLERFGQRLAGMPADRVRVVGTNTLRKAQDGGDFADKARAALQGHSVEIVAGREEARLIYLGVMQTVAAEAGARLVVDIGGGSTECIIGRGAEILEADSLYMGCVGYSERFFGDGKLTAENFENAQIAAQLELQTIAARYAQHEYPSVVGCSGTIHAVHEMAEANALNGSGISRRALKRLRKMLIAQGEIGTLRIPGLEPDRRPVIAGGIAILEALFDSFRIPLMVPSNGAMREGLLYDLVGRIRDEDVRDRTIQHYCQRYEVDVAQGQRIQETALALLQQVAPAWNIEEARAKQLLSWSAQLHEVGMGIAHTGYHRHSAYILANADMAGFSQQDQSQLAAIVRNHRRKLHPEVLEPILQENRAITERLIVLFRLAVLLNRSRVPAPPCVIRAKRNRITLAFRDGWLEEHPLTARDLEVQATLLQAFNYELEVRAA